MSAYNTGPSAVWVDEPEPGTPVFIMRGLITEVPPELEAMDDDALVVVVEHVGWPIPGFHAGYWKQIYSYVIERHRENKFNAAEVACILAAQQKTMDGHFMLKQVHEGYKKGLLRFYWPDGSPYDEYVEGKSDPYHRALRGMYTTPEDINLWLEQWGAKYRFLAFGSAPKKEPIKNQRVNAIREWLTANGHDHKNPSKDDKSGHPGTKSLAKDAMPMACPALRFTPDTFEAAWKELLKENKK